MGLITITKKKTAAPTPVEELLSDFAAEIDVYGAEKEKADQIKAKIKELTQQLEPFKKAEAALAEKIAELEYDADEKGRIEKGVTYQIKVGAQGSSRKLIDVEKVRKLVGIDLFRKIGTVALKEIDKYLTEPQREQVLEVTRTDRSFEVMKRV